jgi:hypothetical protein
MKKLMLAMLLGVVLVSLTACAELPDGVDQQFHTKAVEVFIEVDDDTMELDWEGTDADDQANVDLVSANADSEREIAFSEALDKMVELQAKVIDGDKEAVREYLKERATAMDALYLGDDGNMEEFQVPAFNFGEEE